MTKSNCKNCKRENKMLMVNCSFFQFTLLELLTVLAVIMLLSTILLPALARARERAKQIYCMSNLKQIGTGTGMYASDYKSYLPFAYYSGGARGGYGDSRAGVWYGLLADYFSIKMANYAQMGPTWQGPRSPNVFHCPAESNPASIATYSGGYNYAEAFYAPFTATADTSPVVISSSPVIRWGYLPKIKKPSTSVWIIDSRYPYLVYSAYIRDYQNIENSYVSLRHKNVITTLSFDLHAASVTPTGLLTDAGTLCYPY